MVRALALLALASVSGSIGACAATNAPSTDLWSREGRYEFSGVSIDIQGRTAVIRDDECGEFYLANRKRLTAPITSYEYDLVEASRLTPACRIAEEARYVQLGTAVDDEGERERYPLGSRLNYVLFTGSCMRRERCEMLMGRYLDRDEAAQTLNYREIARRANQPAP